MRFTLRIWRQERPDSEGRLVEYVVDDVLPDMSFLEMLDVLNERLATEGEQPVAFDHDCREGICGMCGLMIDGIAHGPQRETTTCQLYMRHFDESKPITIEPWRAKPFPVVRDLVVNRSAFDRIVESGGYISAPTGSAPDAHAVPVPKRDADRAFEAAACIGCGACVAACPNGSGMLFTAAKATHLGSLPQGRPERLGRAESMLETHDELGFGGCTNTGECTVVCPVGIPLETIARFNRDVLKASFRDTAAS
ncbi:succinate dehydrogenase/fumarate reductase iron-sulfur subunit [Saccharopolyspora sp. NPDC050389]|uniref:succinate dehydrogenase/fumarate reductase iron-sulfur subunit n=1 Tax=Saccharopolyspora sp. NPDC050389 TaxID=3155516 RepID=UPI0033FA15E6